ncbi:ephrin type-B receptor 1-like isoform X1 [Clavelina lepadiformis]|uniref:ephrin type-B receptor 1-like isoform X1 n=1 Tax=Clavelina lepadiformis TaxID=159417 RepID=UPI004041401C
MDYRYPALIWAFIGLYFCLVNSEQETIMDTRNATSDLGWPASGLGWAELTSHDENDADLRTFQVCKIRFPNQNNWIRTPYLEVGSAERVYVEIRFTIRSCEGISRVVSCKETFNLYYLPSNGENEARASHMDVKTYTKVDTIAADERFQPNTMSANTETSVISPVKTRGMYLAFQDTGACMTIMHVRLYYKKCTETLRGLAWFPATTTGPDMTSLVDVRGTCVDNSVPMDQGPAPSLHCNGEGQWLVHSGNCQCKAGFQPNKDLTECNECTVGKFKSSAGNSECQTCPENSFSVDFGSTSCICTAGYFRAPEDRPDVPCTKPPSEPTMAESVVNKTSVTLTWKEPRDKGDREDITYSVSCESCDASYSLCSKCSEGVDFIPRRSGLTRGRLVIQDLSPHTHYKFKIYSFNGVSGVSKTSEKYAQVNIKTNQAAPSPVPPVRVLVSRARDVLLQWDKPALSTSPILDYQIQYSSIHGIQMNVTRQRTFRLQKLTPQTSYIVQVRARSKAGYGLFSRATAFRTKADKATASPISYETGAPPPGHTTDDIETPNVATKSPADNEHLIIGISVACGLLVITLCALIFICGRRNAYSKTSSIDLDKYPGFTNASGEFDFSHTSRTYVDPSTYEDPYTAVLQFAKEIEYDLVNIEQVIGRGEFGEVCKGSLAPYYRPIAIKTLKVGYSKQEKLDFLSEASIMGQFDHPNVIRLEGVVTKSRPLMIITEYMENGSLDAYLKANIGKLNSKQLAQMLHGVASGMKYLTDMGYVHRDLAARNVLVDANLECKVSDFGLSRELEKVTEEEVAMYTTRGGMIPIRWTALEAITKRTFSSSSDVWSFGIVTWEVFSNGERPYWEMSNQDVVHLVESGYRLPPPCCCPRSLHEMMLECWNCDRSRRPTFNQLVALLGHLINESDLLADTVNIRPVRDQDDCIPELLDLSSLGHWLEQMHLLHHKPSMLRYGCVTAEQIMRLTPSELNWMGITDANDVNTLIREADLLRHKIEEVNNVGIAV